MFHYSQDPEEYERRQREAQERRGLWVVQQTNEIYAFLASLDFDSLKTYHGIIHTIDAHDPSPLSSWHSGIAATELRHRFNWCVVRGDFITDTVPNDLSALDKTTNPDEPGSPHE